MFLEGYRGLTVARNSGASSGLKPCETTCLVPVRMMTVNIVATKSNHVTMLMTGPRSLDEGNGLDIFLGAMERICYVRVRNMIQYDECRSR